MNSLVSLEVIGYENEIGQVLESVVQTLGQMIFRILWRNISWEGGRRLYYKGEFLHTQNVKYLMNPPATRQVQHS